MYEKYNPIDSIIAQADDIVTKCDREKYIEYLKIAEKFAITHDVLLGDQIGVDALTGAKLTKNSYIWHLFTDNAFEKSKKLTKELYNANTTIDKKTINLETNLTHKEFSIFIDNRLMFKIYALDKYRNVRLYDLIGPVEAKAFFSKEPVKVISGEMYLIEIYQKLYKPYAKIMGSYKTYTQYKALEQVIYNKTINKLEEKIVGGHDETTRPLTQDMEITEKNLELIKQIIINEMIKKSDQILIGDYAIDLINNTSKHKRLQIITNDDMDELKIIIQRILKNNSYTSMLKYIRYDLNLPSDFRINKYTLYAQNNKGDNIPVMDIFDSTRYELVPFKNVALHPQPAKVKIGGLYVLLRFKFIDLLSMKLIYNLGSVEKSFARGKIRNILQDIKTIRKIVSETDPNDIFQLENYLGEYVNEVIAKKKIINESKFRHKKFYPN